MPPQAQFFINTSRFYKLSLTEFIYHHMTGLNELIKTLDGRVHYQKPRVGADDPVLSTV